MPVPLFKTTSVVRSFSEAGLRIVPFMSEMSHVARSLAVMASSPHAYIHALPSVVAGRAGPSAKFW